MSVVSAGSAGSLGSSPVTIEMVETKADRKKSKDQAVPLLSKASLVSATADKEAAAPKGPSGDSTDQLPDIKPKKPKESAVKAKESAIRTSLVPGKTDARETVPVKRTSKRMSFSEAYTGGEAPGFAVGDSLDDKKRRSKTERKAKKSKGGKKEAPEDTDVEAGAEAAPAASTQGMGACIFTLANTLIGLGLLAMPRVCAFYGVIPFLCATFLMGCLSCATAYIMILGAGACKERAFVALGADAFGLAGGKFAAGLLMVQTFFTLCGYLNVSQNELCINNLAIVLIVVLFMVPLCLLRDLSALKLTSYFACAIYFSVLPTTVYYSFNKTETKMMRADDSQPFEWYWFESPSFGMLRTFSSIVFGFTCQHTVLPIYASLERPTQERMIQVCKSGFFFVWFLYAVVGVSGYMAYGSWLKGDDEGYLESDPTKTGKASPLILTNLPVSTWSQTLRSCFVLAILLGFPCLHFASRKAWTYMVFGPDAEFTWGRHGGITAVICSIVTIGCFTLPSIKCILAWAGATAQPTMMLLLPCACFIKFGNRLPKASNTPFNMTMAKGIILFYFCLVVTLVYTNVATWTSLMEPPAPCKVLLQCMENSFFAQAGKEKVKTGDPCPSKKHDDCLDDAICVKDAANNNQYVCKAWPGGKCRVGDDKQCALPTDLGAAIDPALIIGCDASLTCQVFPTSTGDCKEFLPFGQNAHQMCKAKDDASCASPRKTAMQWCKEGSTCQGEGEVWKCKATPATPQ